MTSALAGGSAAKSTKITNQSGRGVERNWARGFQQSGCGCQQAFPFGHPRYDGHPLLRTKSSPPPGESYRGLTENDSRYCGLSLLRTPNYVPRVFAITGVDCTYSSCFRLNNKNQKLVGCLQGLQKWQWLKPPTPGLKQVKIMGKSRSIPIWTNYMKG